MHVDPVHAMQEHMQEHILILQAGAHQGKGTAGEPWLCPLWRPLALAVSRRQCCLAQG